MSYILAKPVQMCVSEQKYTWKILLYLVYDLLLPRYFKHWYFLINESESLQLRNKDLRHTPNTQVHLVISSSVGKRSVRLADCGN